MNQNAIMHGLFPYQQQGVEFLLQRQHALLLDEQGLGKTVQAVRAADAIEAKRIHVVCPAIARGMWRQAFTDWALRKHDVTITSYDFWSRRQPNGLRWVADPDVFNYDLVLLDEAHYLKTLDSQRTTAIYGKYCRMGEEALASHGRRVWALSGTITPNGAHELYTHFRALFPELIQKDGRPWSAFEFMDRYCTWHSDARGEPKVTGVRTDTLLELRHKLAGIALRRTQQQVLPELPPIRYEVVPMSAAAPSEEYREQLERALDLIESDEITNGVLPTARRLTGLAKADAAFEWVRAKLEGGCEKLVVFAYHRDVIARIEDKLTTHKFPTVTVSGMTPEDTRNRNIVRFQKDPAVRVFLGQITATGTAVTLTAAHDVCFAESSWVPADNAQAAKRCHRIGTVNPVLVSFLTLEGSIDELIQRVLMQKTKALTQLWAEGEVK